MKTCPQCHAIHSDDLIVCPSDDTPLVETDEWPEGTVVKGRYRILSKVGQDSGCSRYKAIHVKRTEFLILNVLHRHLAGNPEYVKLFKQGANQQKKLHHANVAQVVAIDESDDGLPFIVLEYTAGRSLQEVIQQDGPLAPLRACAIAKQVAAGLDAAHRQGIIHRDVKPDWIFLVSGRSDDKIKLLGFGNSQFKEAIVGGQFRTSPDTVIGTVQYLSPEQALGRPSNEVDGRSDLYSLGVILYQMLTHELPFKATHAGDWMIAHIQGSPIPIRVAHADLAIPDPLIDLVMHCLEKNPLHRPASAHDFIREVEFIEREVKRIEKAKRKAAETAGQPKSPGWKFWKS